MSAFGRIGPNPASAGSKRLKSWQSHLNQVEIKFCTVLDGIHKVAQKRKSDARSDVKLR